MLSPLASRFMLTTSRNRPYLLYMTTHERWEKAQAYERKHWEHKAESIHAHKDDLTWYKWRADRLVALLAEHAPISNLDQAEILEIGSGPVGMASFLPGRQVHAIDPLCDFYTSRPDLTHNRNPRVRYVNGGAEQLPWESGKFALVVIDNVIDHTQDPGRVLDEIVRVLAAKGVLYLSVNVRTRWGLMMRKLMERFEVDKGHPHSYTSEIMKTLVRSHGFTVLYDREQDRAEAKRIELKAGHARSVVKFLLGLYDIHFELLARKG